MAIEELKPGDTVIPRRGKGGPWIIAFIGSQPSMFDVGDEKVAVFEDGSFSAVSDLQLATQEAGSTLDRKIRLLAEAAMSVCHGDCGETDPEWHHEVMAMEGKFRKILKGRQ